jgi:hypothetical protein
LNGSQSLDSLKIYNKNEIQKFVQKIRSLKLMIHYFLYLLLTVVCLLTFSTLILVYEYSDLISFGILSAFIYLINNFFWLTLIGFSFLYNFIICYYCKTRFKSFNNFIKFLLSEKSEAFLKYETID